MKPGPPGPPGPPGLPVSGGGDGEGRVGSGGRWQLHGEKGEDRSLLPSALDMVSSHLPVLLALVLRCPKEKPLPPAPVPAAGPCWHRSFASPPLPPPKIQSIELTQGYRVLLVFQVVSEMWFSFIV